MKSKLGIDIPRWRELNPRQRDFISNGCGSKGGWLRPPGFLFTASCDQHDFHYWRGADDDDRTEADAAFLRAMLWDAAQSGGWARWFHRSLAYTYHWAVRRWGAQSFKYRTRLATWALLFKQMRDAGLDPLDEPHPAR